MLNDVRPAVLSKNRYIGPIKDPDITPNGSSALYGDIGVFINKFRMLPSNPVSLFKDGLFNPVINTRFEFPDRGGAPSTVEQEITITVPVPSMAPAINGDLATIQRVIPSIVRISVENAEGEEWFGSGVIVDPADILPSYRAGPGEYFILTNNHVAEGAIYMAAMLPNGHEINAEVVESRYHTKLLDKGMDIALLRIHVPYGLPTATIGDPKWLLPGETIYTAGYPRALPKIAITRGIISNPRQETGSLSLDIQSDAPINPGNSGGPSFNQSGEIIGLNTYTFRGGENMTFTKPIDMQIAALRKLWERGYIIRGSLPFEVEGFSLNDRTKSGFPEGVTGARVISVNKGSLADRAGLKAGDIISWLEARKGGSAISSLDVNVKDGYEAQGVIRRWAADLLPGTEVYAIIWRREGKGYSTYELSFQVEMMPDDG